MPLICQSRWWLLNNHHCMAETATGLSVFKAEGPHSFTVSVCRYSHTSRDGTSRSCWCWIVYICTHTWSYALFGIQDFWIRRGEMCRVRVTHTLSGVLHWLHCSVLGGKCWQMTLFNTVSSAACVASSAVGYSQVEEKERLSKSECTRVRNREKGVKSYLVAAQRSSEGKMGGIKVLAWVRGDCKDSFIDVKSQTFQASEN